jgi:hypothetical protein
MGQKSENNKISLGELVEQYKNKREKYLEEGGSFILSRWMKVKFNRYRLLDQEFLFQKKMHDGLQEIIKDKKLGEKLSRSQFRSQLKKYSHALKTLTIKYSAENTTFTILILILIFSFIISLLRQPLICNEMFWVFGGATLFLLILKIWINETVPVYEELILLIDEYIDSSVEK